MLFLLLCDLRKIIANMALYFYQHKREPPQRTIAASRFNAKLAISLVIPAQTDF